MRKIPWLLIFFLLLGAFAQRLAVIGDWGAQSPHRSLIAGAMNEQHRQKPFDALLTVGDNFYPVGEPILRYVEDLPQVRIYPAFGNHDVPALAKAARAIQGRTTLLHGQARKPRGVCGLLGAL